MNSLENADAHCLMAAIGWLELGNHIEANAELENISPELRAHPDVLRVRLQIYAKEQKWGACLDISEAILKANPTCESAWIHRSVSLHRLGRTRESYDQLKPALELFPKSWHVRYDMACYACQLGKNGKVWELLGEAFDLGDSKLLKTLALDDPDLEPFWLDIGEI